MSERRGIVVRILVVSDTHGRHENLKRIWEREDNIEMLIHLGDIEGGETFVKGLVGCPVEMVAGNNDFFSDLEREKELSIGKYRVLITHGHYYYVAMEMEDLRKEALGRGMDVVMFGHTHKPFLDYGKGITMLNPGSASYPRQDGHMPSYALMELDEKGEAHFRIKYLE